MLEDFAYKVLRIHLKACTGNSRAFDGRFTILDR